MDYDLNNFIQVAHAFHCTAIVDNDFPEMKERYYLEFGRLERAELDELWEVCKRNTHKTPDGFNDSASFATSGEGDSEKRKGDQMDAVSFECYCCENVFGCDCSVMQCQDCDKCEMCCACEDKA